MADKLPLVFSIDANSIASEFGELKEQVKDALVKGVESLAIMTNAKAHELAASQLKTTSKKFRDALSFDNPAEGVYVVSLKESMLWREEGVGCVVFTEGSADRPKVLTTFGWTDILDIKIGDLVLNQHGKWTKVTHIYIKDLAEGSRMEYHETVIMKPKSDKKNDSLRKKVIDRWLFCPKCGHTYKVDKYNQKMDKFQCEKCLEKRDVYQIKLRQFIMGSSRKERTMLNLTGDHLVMTKRGWIRADSLTKDDTVMVPSYKKCVSCNRPTYWSEDVCHSKDFICGISIAQKKVLEEGRHISQQEDFLSKVYSKTISKLKRISGAEEAVTELFLKNGKTVGFYKKEGNTEEIIRQFPFKNDNLKGTKFYFGDFYIPKTKLLIEIDGPFHIKEKDDKRDAFLLERYGVSTIRIPSKKISRKDFWETTLVPIMKNHEGEISFLEYKPTSIKKIKIGKFSQMRKTWDITVEDGESFVINGILIHNSHSMVDDLLKKNYKISSKGEKYKVIPFHHGGGPTQNTPKQMHLLGILKDYLKQQQIPYKGIEKGPDGKPLIGKLHTRNAPSPKPSKMARFPAFSGLNIYQHQTPSGKVERSIVTFRIIKESHKGQGRWFHPGLKAAKILDQSIEWARNYFESDILPDILAKFK